MNDTCFGINNEGGLVFNYSHEDSDQIDGANVYNGQNSTLWVNFRQAFPDKIKETYQDLRSNGVLNYDELIDQFITNGSDKWSESIYNEDGDFKYISMLWSDNDATNLQQVRGTGEEHFRYFIENRLNYCDSKWYATDYANDYVVLRIYTPVDENSVPRTDLVIPASGDIKIIPYSHMYAGARWKANGTLYQKRASANEEVHFVSPIEVWNDTEFALYGASQLSSLGDLAPLYCGYIDVSKATKLTHLKIGDGTTGYFNTNLNHLTVGTNKLLKTIDIRNCPALTTALGLSGCPNIEEIYATGSGITGVELADSGYLKIIELPATIANLTLKNQLYIERLTLEGYSALKTLLCENCPTIDSLAILNNSPNLERARLTNVNWDYPNTDALYALMERDIAGIDENGTNTDTMWIDGKCHIDNLTGNELAEIKAAFPYLTITYDTLTSQLIFMSEDGTTELTRQEIINAGNGTCPVGNGTIETPTKESTAQYDFTFSGWSLKPNGDADSTALLKVEGDRCVYVAFSKAIRSYTVKFYNGTTLLETHTVEYGSDATYTGSTPQKEVTDDFSSPDDFEFTGWKPEPTNIQGDTNCYAQYYDLREITDDWSTIATNCLNGTATSKYAIGAYKPVEITYEDGTTETIPMEVIAHNHDELADGINKWESVSVMPTDYYGGSIVVYNNELHRIGGTQSNTKHYKWNGTEWTEVSTLPYSFLEGGSAVVYNDSIHIFGKQYGGTQHYKWDETNGWVEVNTLPFPSYYSSPVVYNDELHLVGSTINGSHNLHYKWDEASAEWVSVTTLPIGYASNKNITIVYQNELHCFWGKDHYKYNGSTWVSVSTLPYSTSNTSSKSIIVYNNELYLFGTNICYKWNDAEWIQICSLPYNFGQTAQVIVFNNEIHALGGGYNSGNEKKHVKWSTAQFVDSGIATLLGNPEARGMVEYQGKLHVIGGWGTNADHWVYDGTEFVALDPCPYHLPDCKHVVYNNEIHTFYNSLHYKYNGTEWSTVSELSFNVNPQARIVYDGCIYISQKTDRRIIYKYDGTEWISFGNKNVNVYRMEVCNDKLYCTDCKNIYVWENETWVEVTKMPSSYPTGSDNWQNEFSFTSFNNKIHIFHRDYKHYTYDGNQIEFVNANNLGGILNAESTVVYRGKLYTIKSYNKNLYVLENPKATLTFMAKNLLSEQRAYSTVNHNDRTLNGWEHSTLRTWLNNDLLSTFSISLQTAIQNVIKLGNRPDDAGSASNTIVVSNDKVWIGSLEELGLGDTIYVYVRGCGSVYPIFVDATSRIRNGIDGVGHTYWVREIPNFQDAHLIYQNGNAGAVLKTNPRYILFGFCL